MKPKRETLQLNEKDFILKNEFVYMHSLFYNLPKNF